jgi:alkylation response protein AidB-like acyl-CoA dehydrogenase
LQKRITDSCIQTCPAAAATRSSTPLPAHFADGRIQAIYGGSVEIMKDVIRRDIAQWHRS